MTTQEILALAKKSVPMLAKADNEQRNCVLRSMADALLQYQNEILKANAADLEATKDTVNPVMLDRLLLNGERIKGMADGILKVAEFPDPLGRKLKRVERPNGLLIEKVSVPMGVIAIIYESRPNVTSDAAALAIKSGNVCILRGGKEAHRSCVAIVNALKRGLEAAGLPASCVQILEDTTRAGAHELMTAKGFVDLLVPRGGKGLISACVEEATVPCIETGTGICHIYVDEKADISKALDIVENAKTSRPSVCNAAEVLLVHRALANAFLPLLKKRLVDDRQKAGKIPVQLRLDADSGKIISGESAGTLDFDTEFLDFILAVRVVDNVEDAVKHISAHSTHHSEAIVTEDAKTAELFTSFVDSAAVYINASTRFTDGGEFGLGCELGISTQKLHARGPMGLEEMTSYKYVIHGNGQIR